MAGQGSLRPLRTVSRKAGQAVPVYSLSVMKEVPGILPEPPKAFRGSGTFKANPTWGNPAAVFRFICNPAWSETAISNDDPSTDGFAELLRLKK